MRGNNGHSFFRRHWRELVCFLAPIALMLAYDLAVYGDLARLSPDAELYLSIADNFLTTGHFHETARGGQYVVPFGLPLIFTLFRAVKLGLGGIVFIQYLMLGTTCLLLYRTEVNLFGKGGVAPWIYVGMLVRLDLSCGYLFVEHYYLLCLVWMTYLLSCRDMPEEKRLILLNTAGFCSFAIRSVLFLVYLPILVYTLARCLRKKVRPGVMALLVLIPCLLLGVNMAANHRETGYWLLTDNYGGEDLYTANNPCTLMEHYTTDQRPRFVGEEYFAVQNDPSLDFTGRNAVYAGLARDWILAHPGQFLKNTAVKFIHLFVGYWKFLLLPALAAAVWWICGKKDGWGPLLIISGAGLLLAAATSVGLMLGRYTAVVLPAAALQYSAGWRLAAAFLSRKKIKDLSAG